MGVALCGSGSATGATLDWSGAVSVLNEDTGGAYTGTMLGDRFFGQHNIPDICVVGPASVVEPDPDPQKDETTYVFASGTAFLSDGTTLTNGDEASVNIENNVALDADEAALVSLLTGMNIQSGELVDVWAGASETSGGTLEWEVIYLSLDESLYNDSSYRPTPPALADVDLVLFSIEETNLGVEIFSALPEPGAATSVCVALFVLAAIGARRRGSFV